MSEIRHDPTTKEWVIIAVERAKRPSQNPAKKRGSELPEHDESCPFCPGNEVQTPDEVLLLPENKTSADWEVRVVPNRFAALSPKGHLGRMEEGHLFRKMDGFGIHEVIIESPSHNTPVAMMPYQQVEMILTAYQNRYNVLKGNKDLRFITIFKNHGFASGTSLVHPHSQLVATPIITPHYHQKFDIAHDYRATMGTCLYCDLLADELEKGERIVAETDKFIILQPYASRVPFETWIIPKEHDASFGLISTSSLNELAKVLKDILFCIYHELNNPAYNMMIETSTTEDEEDPYYHWHIRIVPRLSTIAGFELGSGIFITTALPEETTLLLRQCCVSNAKNDAICLIPFTK